MGRGLTSSPISPAGPGSPRFPAAPCMSKPQAIRISDQVLGGSFHLGQKLCFKAKDGAEDAHAWDASPTFSPGLPGIPCRPGFPSSPGSPFTRTQGTVKTAYGIQHPAVDFGSRKGHQDPSVYSKPAIPSGSPPACPAQATFSQQPPQCLRGVVGTMEST